MSKSEETRSVTLRRIQRRRKLAGIRKTIIASAFLTAALATYCYAGRLPYPVSELAELVESATTRNEEPRTHLVAASGSENPRRSFDVSKLPMALDQSDPFVRQLAGALSTQPQLATWLVNDGLVRRLAVSVANVAEGLSPSKQLAFLAPQSSFLVVERDDRLFIDAGSGRRYDVLAKVFASLDVDALRDVYLRLRALLFSAYADLGYPDSDFEDALRRALEELRDTPTRDGEIELIRVGKSYRYADPELELMSSAQKQLFRMGPRNQELVRGQLVAIARALEALALRDAPAEHANAGVD